MLTAQGIGSYEEWYWGEEGKGRGQVSGTGICCRLHTSNHYCSEQDMLLTQTTACRASITDGHAHPETKHTDMTKPSHLWGSFNCPVCGPQSSSPLRL